MGDAAAYDPITVHIETPLTCGIYRLSFPDGRFYVGSSKKIYKRLIRHMGSLRRGDHHSWRLQRAWNKHQSISMNVLLLCREEDLLFYEQICIDNLKPQLNVSLLAGRGSWEPESRTKVAASMRGRKVSPGSLAALAKVWEERRGKPGPKQSEESLRKRSESMKGKNTWSLGRKATEEHRLKISLSLKGNKRRVGCRLSDEHKRSISEASKGNKHWQLRRTKRGVANV